ncbi:hypothetical protein BCR35DRAFT_219143 [Leucosporidium creatinivorum]|uniref:Uncharacterized protein n=1 Tax=Leucosporidium creatinivorum TaxID=106004 RepID=A0A1Y2FX47_9BASI|nr:hypothetical protein BCR35DRAFT_219143 [Leucosporidium creatinivorum]
MASSTTSMRSKRLSESTTSRRSSSRECERSSTSRLEQKLRRWRADILPLRAPSSFYKHVVIPAFRDEKREPSELKLGSSRRLGYSTISWLPNVLAQLLTVYDDPDTGFAGESNLMGEIVHIISPSSSSAITTIAPRYRGTAADETLPSAASSSEDVETAAVADFALRTRQDVLNHASKLEMAQGVTKHQQAQAVVLAYEGDAWRMKTGKCFTLSPKGEDLLYPSDAGRYRLRPLFERYTTDELVTRFRNKGTLTGTFQIYG